MDQLYHNAIKFAANYTKQHQSNGVSNIYVIQKKDVNGSVIGEYYGMNRITEYGFNQFFINEETFPTNVYFGKSDLNIQISDDIKSIIEPISDSAATIIDSTIDYGYPLFITKDTLGDITSFSVMCKYLTVSIPANSPNFPSDKTTITEYGIGESINALWTYSRIYNENGDPIIVDRDPSESFDITIYFTMNVGSYYFFQNSNIPIITTMHRFFDRFHGVIKTVKNDKIVTRQTRYDPYLLYNDNCRIRTLLENMRLSNVENDANGYIDGIIDHSDGFLYAEPTAQNQHIEKLIQPDINSIFGDNYVENLIASNPWSDSSYTSIDGNGYRTSFFRKSVYGDFTNGCDSFYEITPYFLDHENGGLVPSLMRKEYAVPIYVLNDNNNIDTYYIYRNTGSISSIRAGLTCYVTDKYYDKSTWEPVSGYTSNDRFVIYTSAQRTKKFFITTTNTVDLLPPDYVFPYRAIRAVPSGYAPTDIPNGIVCQYGSVIGNVVMSEGYTIPNMSPSLDDTFVYSSKVFNSPYTHPTDENVDWGYLLIEKNATSIRSFWHSNMGYLQHELGTNTYNTITNYASALFDSYISTAGFWNLYEQSNHDKVPAVCLCDANGMLDILFRAPGTYTYEFAHIYDNTGNVVSACVIDGNINNIGRNSYGDNEKYLPSFEEHNNNEEYATNDEIAYQFDAIRVAIITADDPRTLKIYRFNTDTHLNLNSPLSDFTPYMTIPIGTSSTPAPKMVYAYDQLIAVSDAASYTWIAKVKDINTVSSQMFNTPIPFTTFDTSVRYADHFTHDSTNIENLFIIYKYDDPNMSHAYLVTTAGVTNLGSIDVGTQNKGNHCKYTIAGSRTSFALIYSAEYQTSSGVTNEVYDLSQFIYNGTVPTPFVDQSDPGKMYITSVKLYDPDLEPSARYVSVHDVGILTRGKWFQLNRFIPIKYIADTDAVTAVEGDKIISATWSVDCGLDSAYQPGLPM